MRLIKGFIYICAGLLVVAMAAVAYVTQVLDPNDLKPTLIKTAKSNQIELTLDGPIEWTFYPWLGVSVERVSASSALGAFNADRLDASISLLSVFSETPVIDQLELIAPLIELNSEINSEPTDTGPTNQPPLIVRAISIVDGTIQGLPSELELHQLNLSIETLSPNQESQIALETQLHRDNVQIPLALQATIIPSADFNSLTAQQITVKSRAFDAEFDGFASVSLAGNMAAEGQLTVAPFSPRQWLSAANLPQLNTESLDAFNQLSMNTTLQLSENQVTLRPLEITLDQSAIQGAADLTLDTISLNLEAQIDRLNLDSYLINEDSQEAESKTAPGLLLGSYQIGIQALESHGITARDVQLDMGVQSDELTLSRLEANVFDGRLRVSGNHLAVPQITNLNGTLEQMKLSAMPHTASIKGLEGTLSGAFDLRTAGQNFSQWAASLTGPARFNLKDGELQGIQISEAICQALDQATVAHESGSDTAAIRLQFQEGVAQIENLGAKIANLRIESAGRFSVVSTGLNLRGDVFIPADGNLGLCNAPEQLHGLTMPFQCRGQIKEQDVSCGLDQARLKEAMGKRLEEEARKRAQNEIQNRLNDALQGPLEDQAQDLLKNLLGR